MSTPTIHLPTLPDVTHVDVSDVADRALDKVQELAAAALDRASDLATAAAERIEDLPEKAIGLAGAAIPALRPTRKRSKRPFVLLAVVLLVVGGGVWFWRRRSAGDSGAPYAVPDEHTQRAVSAAS
jgi:hypothetical protein